MPVIPIARAAAVLRSGWVFTTLSGATRFVLRRAAASTASIVRGTSSARPGRAGMTVTLPESTSKVAFFGGLLTSRWSRRKNVLAARPPQEDRRGGGPAGLELVAAVVLQDEHRRELPPRHAATLALEDESDGRG